MFLELFGVEPFEFGGESGVTGELVGEEREYGD